jgi:hypothetical protein
VDERVDRQDDRKCDAHDQLRSPRASPAAHDALAAFAALAARREPKGMSRFVQAVRRRAGGA